LKIPCESHAFRQNQTHLFLDNLEALLVINPDLTSQIASRIGIGRGTDLLIYLFILASLFHAANVRAQLKHLQEQLTVLMRNQALQQPLFGPTLPQNGEKKLMFPADAD
jgi:hypothetical protein